MPDVWSKVNRKPQEQMQRKKGGTAIHLPLAGHGTEEIYGRLPHRRQR